MSATMQPSTPSDSDRPQTPESSAPSARALWSSCAEPIRIPIDVGGATMDLYAIPAPALDVEGMPAIANAGRTGTPAPMPLHGFNGADESDPFVWDQLSFALAQIEGARDAAAHEIAIRRAVHRCADAAAGEAWTLERFIGRFQLTIERPVVPTNDDAALRSMLHQLHARFIAKVLDWGIERFFVASEALRNSDGGAGARSA